MKEHEIRELVNSLTDIAVKYHDSQSLRERISHLVCDSVLKSYKGSWKPIETAPLFTEVMVWPFPTDNTLVAEKNTKGEWWYFQYDTGFGYESYRTYPTHWMPLPKGPVEE